MTGPDLADRSVELSERLYRVRTAKQALAGARQSVLTPGWAARVRQADAQHALAVGEYLAAAGVWVRREAA